MTMTNKDRLAEAVVERDQVRRDLEDVLSAFREKVQMLRTAAAPGEKSVAVLVDEMKKRLAGVEQEISRCAQQPNQLVMEL